MFIIVNIFVHQSYELRVSHRVQMKEGSVVSYMKRGIGGVCASVCVCACFGGGCKLTSFGHNRKCV